jgi:signal transduction histidine kinase
MDSILTLLETGIGIRQINPAEALVIFNKAYSLAKESEDEKYIVESVFNMAIAYLNLANYSESLRHFIITLDYEYTHNNPKLIAEVHRGIAAQYLRTYNYKEALKYLYRAESLSIDANHLDNLHLIYGSFGSLYNKLKFYDKALEYTLKSLRLAEQINSAEMIQYSKMSVGACYYQLQQFEKANEYLNDALDGENQFAITNALHFLAEIKFDNKQLKKAFTYSLRQVEIGRKYNYYEYEGLGLRMLGDVMLAEGKYDEALVYYEEGIDLLKDVGEKPVYFSLLYRLINLYEETGETALAMALYKKLSIEHVEHLQNELRLQTEHIDIHSEIEKIKIAAETEKNNNIKLHDALEKVKRLNEKLNDANREKNDFMSLVIHDLKNPLQNIRSTIRMLGTISDEKIAKEYTENVLSQTDRMFNLISKLLDYRAIEDGKLKIKHTVFKPKDIFSDIMINLNPQALEKNLKMICLNECGESELNTDYIILYQIMENLVSNAIKFSPRDRKIILKSYSTGEGVTFEVADEGPGFSKSDMKKVFSSFARLSAQPTANENSTGLGLSITKKLGKLIGGNIELESREGKGAKFYLALKGAV